MTDLAKKLKKNSPSLGSIFFLLILLLSTAVLSNQLFNLNSSNHETSFFFTRIAIWFCLLFIYMYAIIIEKRPFLLWKEKKYALGFYIKSIISTMLVLILVVFALSLTFKLADSNIDSEKMKVLVQVFKKNRLLLVFTCLTAGITEEIIFRGYLLPRLEILLKNKNVSVIISSLFFGLIHYGYGTSIQIIGPILIGLVFGVHYQKYRNIKILIICHFLWDLIALLVKTSQTQ